MSSSNNSDDRALSNKGFLQFRIFPNMLQMFVRIHKEKLMKDSYLIASPIILAGSSLITLLISPLPFFLLLLDLLLRLFLLFDFD